MWLVSGKACGCKMLASVSTQSLWALEERRIWHIKTAHPISSTGKNSTFFFYFTNNFLIPSISLECAEATPKKTTFHFGPSSFGVFIDEKIDVYPPSRVLGVEFSPHLLLPGNFISVGDEEVTTAHQVTWIISWMALKMRMRPLTSFLPQWGKET